MKRDQFWPAWTIARQRHSDVVISTTSQLQGHLIDIEPGIMSVWVSSKFSGFLSSLKIMQVSGLACLYFSYMRMSMLMCVWVPCDALVPNDPVNQTFPGE